MSEFYRKEIERIGAAIGLEGKFLVDWGTENIIEGFKINNKIIERAREMLNVAARYIETVYPNGIIFYDDDTCDGEDVASDCREIAEELMTERPKGEGK